MFRSFIAALVAAVVFILVPRPAAAQSLGEAAAKQAEERAKKKSSPPPKVITNEDLRRAKGNVTVLELPAATEQAKPAAEGKPAEGAAKAKPEPTEDEQRAAAEKEWRDKLTQAQADVTRLKADVDRIQTSLNDPNLSFYGTGRATLSNQLDEAKKALAAAQQSVSDLEDTGRKARYRQ